MKAKAVIEVVVVFILTLGLAALVGRSPIGAWGRQVTGRAYIEYIVFIAVPLAALLIARRRLAENGLNFRNLSYHLNVAGVALGPAFVASAPLAFFNYLKWDGALVMVVVEMALLVVVAWLLRNKPTRNEGGAIIGSAALIGLGGLAQAVTVGGAVSALVYYVFFLALGEELLFRGYMQSRLNAAFGRPFKFFGVNWGWGLIITCVLFGIMHLLNTGSLIRGAWQLTPWWGLWTLFGGLVGGFLREKTGSIAAPTLIHGLPQGIFSALTGV